MAETNTSIRDTGPLGALTEQLRTKGNPDHELLHLQIMELAYFKAQARGCQAGPEMTDWLQAEAEFYATHQRPQSHETNDGVRSKADAENSGRSLR